MNNKHKLWQIFGPVICAFILLGILFLIPWHFTNSSDSFLFKASVSRSNNVFKGEKIKQAAFEKEYVPFYGSSELSRMDPMHPSVLAYKYKRNYKPFLLGGPGSQSLTHYFGMQGTSSQLTNKKAVMIISPQWFTKEGQNPAAFSMYFSQLQAVEWILNAKNSEATRYAAKRLLTMPSGTADETTKSALETLAKGKSISSNMRTILRARHRILENEDDLFSSLNMPNNVPKIQSGADKLPGTYAYDNLRQIATDQGAEHTSNNRFDISNAFYKHRLGKKEVKRLKGSQKDFDYTKSPEYGDLELVLNQFAQQHTNVLFIIPPVNSKWAKYTGLSESMYQEATNKIIKQLTSQGFTNIANLTKDGNKKYFMEDTIHLGWNGWLTVDQYVQPFMKQQNQPINYYLNNYYYSKAWANKTNVNPSSVKKNQNIKSVKKKIKLTLNDQNFKGTVLVIKNGKKYLSYSKGLANQKTKRANTADTTYLINSVQKVMTATMFIQAVQAKKVKLSDKLSKFYPQAPAASKITMRQLLQMTSGLVYTETEYGTPKYKNNKAGIKYDLSKTKFEQTNYNKRTYQPINYVLLAGIIEKVNHNSYENIFKETFIKRLKLKETTFVWSKVRSLPRKMLATSYSDNNTPIKLNMNELRGEFGTGSVVMSNKDLYKTIRAILDGTLLSKRARNSLFEGSSDAVLGGNYGGGFYNFSTYHAGNGAGNGYTNFARVSNDGKTAIIIQANYPIKNYFKLRNEMNNLIEILLSN